MTASFSGRDKEKDRFHKLDYQVMKHAFEMHNRMGNCHDEVTCQNELLHLLTQNGIQAQKEVSLLIEFRSFRKTYYQDLLIEGEHIYELKVLLCLTNQCRSQIINYQLIQEKTYGKLINSGPSSVEHEFSTSTLTRTDRQDISVDCSGWNGEYDFGKSFFTLAIDLFSDWGSRLDPSLYSEALMSLLPNGCEKRIDVLSDKRTVGSKLVRLAETGIAFKITTSKKPNPLEIQFQKFINHTNLQALLWVNLNKNRITFRALKKNDPVIS